MSDARASNEPVANCGATASFSKEGACSVHKGAGQLCYSGTLMTQALALTGLSRGRRDNPGTVDLRSAPSPKFNTDANNNLWLKNVCITAVCINTLAVRRLIQH